MQPAWHRSATSLRNGFSALGRALGFLLASALVTVVLASPLIMLRAGFLAPGSETEKMEIGHLAGAISALAATALVMRLLEAEGARLRDVGLYWRSADRRNLLLGLAGGVGAALLVTLLPLTVGAAVWKPVDPSAVPRPDLHNFVYCVVVLSIGSFAEELTMRGYPFQVLLRWMGLAPTLIATSALFAALHATNPGATWPAVLNTFLYGAALGLAMARSGSLWLPIGLHAGWNLTLPLFGANLSGFRYRLTIYEMDWKIPDWLSGGAYGPEGGLLASLALTAWLLWILRAPIVRQQAFILRRDPPEDLNPGA